MTFMTFMTVQAWCMSTGYHLSPCYIFFLSTVKMSLFQFYILHEPENILLALAATHLPDQEGTILGRLE